MRSMIVNDCEVIPHTWGCMHAHSHVVLNRLFFIMYWIRIRVLKMSHYDDEFYKMHVSQSRRDHAQAELIGL